MMFTMIEGEAATKYLYEICSFLCNPDRRRDYDETQAKSKGRNGKSVQSRSPRNERKGENIFSNSYKRSTVAFSKHKKHTTKIQPSRRNEPIPLLKARKIDKTDR